MFSRSRLDLCALSRQSGLSAGIEMDRILSVEWIELFVPTHSIAEVVLRGTLMYLGMFLIFRFVVKRQASSIGIADLIVIVIIADAAQNAFSKEYTSVTEGVALVLTIVFWDQALDWLGYRFRFFAWLTKSEPVRLIQGGKMLRANMRRELITAEELRSQARQQGIANIRDVEGASLEANGEISFIKKEQGSDGAPRSRKRKAG